VVAAGLLIRAARHLPIALVLAMPLGSQVSCGCSGNTCITFYTARIPVAGGVNGTFTAPDVGLANACDQSFTTARKPEDDMPVGDGLGDDAYVSGFSFEHWRGPGTYQVSAGTASDFSSDATLVVRKVKYTPGTGSVTVNADGSGSFSFRGFRDSAGHMVSADGTWTCEVKQGNTHD
jgi:hypothetical protein